MGTSGSQSPLFRPSLEHRPSCLSQTRYNLLRPRTEFSIFLPHRDSKYGAHCGSCGLAPALILICRFIGVSDAVSKMTSLVVPSSFFSVAANTQFRSPFVLKYLSFNQRTPFLGCLPTDH